MCCTRKWTQKRSLRHGQVGKAAIASERLMKHGQHGIFLHVLIYFRTSEEGPKTIPGATGLSRDAL